MVSFNSTQYGTSYIPHMRHAINTKYAARHAHLICGMTCAPHFQHMSGWLSCHVGLRIIPPCTCLSCPKPSPHQPTAGPSLSALAAQVDLPPLSPRRPAPPLAGGLVSGAALPTPLPAPYSPKHAHSRHTVQGWPQTNRLAFSTGDSFPGGAAGVLAYRSLREAAGWIPLAAALLLVWQCSRPGYCLVWPGRPGPQPCLSEIMEIPRTGAGAALFKA